MQKHKVMSLDFRHSEPGKYFASEEEFKQDCMESLQYILIKRSEFLKTENGEINEASIPPLPLILNVYFENGSYATSMLFPESDNDKQYLLTGAKKMLDTYNKSKKVTSVFLIMEAWLAEIDTKQMKKDNQFAKEMTEEQLQRRISREWKENKHKKITRIICEYQTPVIVNNKQHTAITTSVYSLFEHKILIPDEHLSMKMNSDKDVTKQTHKPWFYMFTDVAPENQVPDEALLNFSIYTATEFLKELNKLM